MGVFSDMHTETLYYRAPSTNATAADSFGDPTYGAPVSYLGNVTGLDGRTTIEMGLVDVLGVIIQTHTEILKSYLVFGPGDDGTDATTGRHPFDVQANPMGPIGETGTLYEAKA